MVEKFSNLHLWLLKILESAFVAIKPCLEWTSEPMSIYSGDFLRTIYALWWKNSRLY